MSSPLGQLRDVLPEEQLNFGASDRTIHGQDVAGGPPSLPEVVAYPSSTQEVSRVLAWAQSAGTSVVPFGAGSGLERHAVPDRGGISLDLRRMSRVLEVHDADMAVTAQAGLTRLALESVIGPRGLFLPVDPGADATLGGMAATNAAGTMTLRFGKMRDRVLALEAVLADGRVIRTGTRARKSSAGYDLTSLLVGSEGTLAIITELTLRLEPIPEQTLTARVSLSTIEAACELVAGLVLLGSVRRIELMDAWEAAAVARFGDLSLPDGVILLIELAGDGSVVAAADEDLRDLIDEHRGQGVEIATDHTAQRRLWRVRHDAFFAELATAPGKQSVSTDVCVPVSALATAMTATRRHLDDLGLTGGLVAHAGDGNVHAGVLIDRHDPDEMKRLARFLDAIVDDALRLGGTCTGEHGIGAGKQRHLLRQHHDLIPLMRAIKSSFDPRGVLNPGKVLP